MRMPSDTHKSWLGELAKKYHNALLGEPKILSYLAGRGLDPGDVAGARLGLVVEPDPAHNRYAGWLSIPFITPTGVVYMRFRCLEMLVDPTHECEGHGKYEGPKGEDTHLYNVGVLSDPKVSAVGVTEGELDAWLATKAGLPSVGVPGAQGWKPFYTRLLDDYDRVIILGDGDRAGHDFIAKVAPGLGNSVQRPMPTGHDVSSFINEYGAGAFLAYVGL